MQKGVCGIETAAIFMWPFDLEVVFRLATSET